MSVKPGNIDNLGSISSVREALAALEDDSDSDSDVGNLESIISRAEEVASQLNDSDSASSADDWFKTAFDKLPEGDGAVSDLLPDQAEIARLLSIAYETKELSNVLQVFQDNVAHFPNLEEAKIHFAVHFLKYIECEDPVQEIRDNAELFENAAAVEKRVREHFAAKQEAADEAGDLRGRINLQRQDSTFDPKLFRFVLRHSEVDRLRDQVATIESQGFTFSSEDLAFIPKKKPAPAADHPPLLKRPEKLLAQVRRARQSSRKS